MKERPILFSAPMVRAILGGTKTQTRRPVKNLGFVTGIGHLLNGSDNRSEWPDFCPHGKTGDRLWVRETWHPDSSKIDGSPAYKADVDYDTSDCKWKPSIYMPRKASRIDLEITGIRVERLHDISEEDCRAEGIIITDALTLWRAYQSLWESINGKSSWGLNPWVWVIEFRRI